MAITKQGKQIQWIEMNKTRHKANTNHSLRSISKSNGKEEKAETQNTKSTFSSKENLLSIFENLIRKNADNNNTDLEKYIESYQLLKEKNIISVSELKESIVTLRDKNYKTTRAIKDTEKQIDDRVQLIDHAEKYLKEHLGESKTLNISKWKLEVATLKKKKNSLYNQILDIREEVKQAEKVKNCIEQLQEHSK